MGELMDQDNLGVITLDDFVNRVEDEHVKTYFAALDLDAIDATLLFRLLDLEGGQGIEVDDFVAGCLRLKGLASSCDMFRVMYDLKKVRAELHSLIAGVEAKIAWLDANTYETVEMMDL